MGEHEGGRESGIETRLSFVSMDPVVLDASNADDWQSPGSLLENLQRAWMGVQNDKKTESIDLTMPAL
eukprot:scaffold3809_cov162-Pinguiococcus_pyrenoidosus.AAC.1